MIEPIRRVMVRWQCPHCLCTRSKRRTMREHVARCWHNPAARACTTCDFRVEASGDNGIEGPFSPPSCLKNVSLSEHGVNVHCSTYERTPDENPELRNRQPQ